MKVLQVNILGATLSTGRTTRELHDYFISHNIESYIACPTNKDCDDAFTFTTPNKIKVDYVLTKYTGKEGFFSSGPTNKLLRYIEKIKPDIVHLRVLHGNCIHLKKLLSFLAKKDIATVITMHDFWYMTGMCFYHTKKDCQKWQSGCNNCPAIAGDIREKKFDRTRLMWETKKKCFNSIPRLAVIGVSDWTLGEVKKSFLKNAAVLKRIYNWIDLDVFCPQDSSELKTQLGLNDKYVILGVSAAWIKGDGKGLDTYLKLAEKLSDDCRIVLIGEMKYEGKLPDNVISISSINSKTELAKHYSMADVYLNVSHEETFGKVSAEAVSCGVPVVAYNATANKELVPVGGGALVETLEADDILKAIEKVKSQDKSVYLPICRKFAENNFNKEENIRQYISVYEELININKR